MKISLQITSFLALTAFFLASGAYLFGSLEKDLLKQILMTSTIAWFLTAPFWINQKN
ncbi:hypothetical protein [Pelagicoccus albus]|uniref:Uncharacterized protein n=1 Tax=Pelagicoccus albus TaxID=415222 RepID=A0A7X1B3L1_9BACT|nr:hypothetical protein [Pelagicoccus albus]MBC2605006.1 hypothetical protein [Pelagicoccus albus]